jgi:DNA polymerase III subunit alpha
MENKGLNPNYVSLHQHSIGSLRDGIMKVEDHVNFALNKGKKYVAITDHGSVAEWIELYNQCAKKDLTPIFGVEGYIKEDRKAFLKNKEGKINHIVLLALNEVGFKNIIKIHNEAWNNFYKKPIMSYDYIEENNEGVVLTTACLSGTLAKYLEEKDFANADKFVERMKDSFGDRFFIELMFIESEDQIERNRQLANIAKKHDVPMLINSDAHYVTEEDAEAHQLSLLLQSNKTIKDLEAGNAWSFSAKDLYLKDEKELYKFWSKHYKNDKIITREVVYQATWNVDKITSRVEEIYLEHPPRIPRFKNGYNNLKDLVINGFEEKIELNLIPEDRIDEYTERIGYELKTIKEMGLVDYFILIHDIVQWCHENDIGVGPGRGSVSASLVTWLIDITKLDPIKHRFIFERFLNPARKTKLKVFE